MTWISNRVENIRTGYAADRQVMVDVCVRLSMLISGCIIFLCTCPSSCLMERWEATENDSIFKMYALSQWYFFLGLYSTCAKTQPQFCLCANHPPHFSLHWQTQDVWGAGAKTVKRALVVCGATPACKQSSSTWLRCVYRKCSTSSCYIYDRGNQEDTFAAFFLTLAHLPPLWVRQCLSVLTVKYIYVKRFEEIFAKKQLWFLWWCTKEKSKWHFLIHSGLFC